MSTLPCACLLAILSALPLPQAAPPAGAAETATQVYLRFRAVAMNARSIDEITGFWGPDLMQQFNMMPDADKAGTVDVVKRMEKMLTDVKVIKEAPTKTGATLFLEATGPDKTAVIGTVDMVKQDGRWKLAAQEKWQPKG
jgi:hypothetical protein